MNADSDLYRAHPDWAIRTPHRKPSHGRNEYLLNFADAAVVDNIFEQMSALLGSANISYIKWDMNRFVSEGYDLSRDAEHQGEAYHRYILGVYDLLEPAAHGLPGAHHRGLRVGRWPVRTWGMLFYTPQIWCSDDSDAIERLKIQYGTSMFYPLSTMGAHVSITPNHQTMRSRRLPRARTSPHSARSAMNLIWGVCRPPSWMRSTGRSHGSSDTAKYCIPAISTG